jgi:hypothetical protein
MKHNKLRFIFFVIGIVFVVFSSEAYCQGNGMALLVQVSPPGAGVVTPQPGVHHFASDSQVNLSASPNQGYQFVYWLGDVVEPAKGNTLAVIDSPKIIIAVFERSNFDFSFEEQLTALGPGSEGVFRSAQDLANRGGGGVIRRRQSVPSTPPKPPDNGDEEEPDFPVPEEPSEPEFPVPEVPEPATGGLFLIGTLMVIARRRKRKRC